MNWGQELILSSCSLAIVRTTNEEAAAWAENTAFRKEILGQPWLVSGEDEERARRKAEGLDREKRAREERKRRRMQEWKEEGRRTAAGQKETRRAERKRRGGERGGRDGEAGLSRRQDAEQRDPRRDAEKARKSKV